MGFNSASKGLKCTLTLILLTWRIWWATNNASRWQMGFNWAFEGLKYLLTLILLTWRIWWAPNNASRWQMGFNWAFKGLKCPLTLILLTWRIWWAPNNTSRWQMGFNWAFKGLKCTLTLILLTWRIWWAPNNASRWQMGFNWVFNSVFLNCTARYLLRLSHCADETYIWISQCRTGDFFVVAIIKVAACSIPTVTRLSPDDCQHKWNTKKSVVAHALAKFLPFSPYAIKVLCLV